jgi:hypothetical protein
MSGYYDPERLRTQSDIIHDKLLVSSQVGNGLTLEELHLLTGFGECSISAQIRHLRAIGFLITKKRRKFAGRILWEYRIEGGARGSAPDGEVA